MIGRLVASLVATACLAGAGGIAVDQVRLHVKARIAERAIAAAWSAHLRDGDAHRPWPWADTHPVARLRVPGLGVERTVLAGATGSSLAFGVGHVDGTARPDGPGNVVLAGHRDGAFAFLERLEVGTPLALVTRTGSRRFRVATLRVTSARDVGVLDDHGDDRLTLITCWPFDVSGPGDRRYVVVALPDRDVAGDQGRSDASLRAYFLRNGWTPGISRESAATSLPTPAKTSSRTIRLRSRR